MACGQLDEYPLARFGGGHTRVCGVYSIRCERNGREYVGSSNNIEARFTRGHLCDLRAKKHHNAGLQADFDEFGEAAFLCRVLHLASPDELLELERKYTAQRSNAYNSRLDIGTKAYLKVNPQKFWGRVQVGSNNECWLWTGGRRGKYGRLLVGTQGLLVHRISYFIHNGCLPPRGVVRHTCNNKLCVNPLHLQDGTPKDNQADIRKDPNNTFKISLELANGIRRWWTEGKTAIEIGNLLRDKYALQIATATVYSIVQNRMVYDEGYAFVPRKKKISPDQAKWICERRINTGRTYQQIANDFELEFGFSLNMFTVLKLCTRTSRDGSPIHAY